MDFLFGSCYNDSVSIYDLEVAMLNIVFGRENLDAFELDARLIFRRNKKPEWFQDELVKRFLKAIDGTTVLFEEALLDYKGRGISTEMISTGCKTLCCIYFLDGWFYGSLMGDNCVPFLLEIAAKKVVNIMLEHFLDIPDECFDTNDIRVNGSRVTVKEYENAYCVWCESTVEGIDGN